MYSKWPIVSVDMAWIRSQNLLFIGVLWILDQGCEQVENKIKAHAIASA